MQRRTTLALAALWLALLAVAGCGGGASANPGADAAARAARWLAATHQNDDGGYTNFSAGAGQAPSDPAGTVDALLALATAGGDTEPALGYLRANGAALQAVAAESGGQAGKVLLALVAAGADPRNFAGVDFAGPLLERQTAAGDYGAADAFNQSLAMLGLAAAGETLPETAAVWLEGKQAANGSWDDGFGTIDNPDATAMAIMALLAAGRAPDDAAVAAAIDFLAGAQAAEGGWGYGPGLPPDANSTALAIQALIALGQDVTATDGRWALDGRSPLAALLAFQSDSGAFQADFGDGPFDDFLSTVQAIPAAAGRAWPPAAGEGDQG